MIICGVGTLLSNYVAQGNARHFIGEQAFSMMSRRLEDFTFGNINFHLPSPSPGN